MYVNARPSRLLVCAASVATIIALVGTSRPAHAQFARPAVESPAPTWTIIDRELRPIATRRVLSIVDDQLTFLPAPATPGAVPPATSPATDPPADTASPRVIALRDVLAVVPAGWFATGARVQLAEPLRDAVLTLTDGSRLVGGMPGGAFPAESVVWRHARLGRLTYKLDRVRAIASAEAVVAPASSEPGQPITPANADRLILTNADVLNGFVVSFVVAGTDAEPAQQQVRFETNGKATLVPLARVAEIKLVNPPVAPTGPRVWLSDGSVFSPAQIGQSDDRALRLRIEREPGAVGESEIPAGQTLGWAPDAARVRALAELPLRSTTPGPDQRWTPPVITWRDPAHPEVLGADDVELPGVSATWSLPPGAARIAGFLVLPDDARAWGQVRVIVEALGPTDAAAPIELARAELSASTPEAPFNAPIPRATPGQPAPTRLRVRLEPGSRGSVGARVLLRRVLIAVS